MRRTWTALALALILLFGSFACAEGEPEIFSYDFDIRLRLNAEALPFGEREYMQGYADLLEILEFKGNFSYCPGQDSSDLYLTVIPTTHPASAVSFHIWGIENMHRVTSPLFGDKELSFNPGAFLGFSISAREVLQIQLPRIALMNPRTTVNALRNLSDIWAEKAGNLQRDRTVSFGTILEIADAWKAQLEAKTKISYWSEALVDPSLDDGLAARDLREMPGRLAEIAGKKGLTVRREGNTATVRNSAGEVLFEQTEAEGETAYALTLPESERRYFPCFSWREKTEDGRHSWALDAEWACAEETARTDPETGEILQRLDLHVAVNGLPAALPAEAEITGELAQTGFLLPAFRFRMAGKITPEGQVRIALERGDRPEAGEVFVCEGTVTPSVHEAPMVYDWSELNSEYNILSLNYADQSATINAVKKPLVLGMIDFLYELPASSCQSIMDYLEETGVLKTLLSGL